MIDLNFEPFPFLEGPKSQTIIGSFFTNHFSPPSTTEWVLLPDGDMITLEVSTPRGWKEQGLTVLMVHGLCGSHKSPYIVRIANKLLERNLRVIRMNFRGCGTGKGKARFICHGGQSDDLFEAVKHIKIKTPSSPIVLMGFSLGAAFVLKLAGELGDNAPKFLTKVLSVHPPIDLFSTISLLGKPENHLYESYFTHLLKADALYRQKIFSDLPKVDFPKEFSLLEFDRLYTVPLHGFASPEEYYEKGSARSYLSAISVPTNILLSKDDPIISLEPFKDVLLPPCVELYVTEKGGHMGYFGRPGDRGVLWMDKLLEDWALR